MKSLSRRISDRHLLGLIKMWLVAPVEEIDERGRTRRTTRNKDERRGSPQGSPLSLLLANIYMCRFIVGWKVLGHEQRLDAHIVNYADDFVICCRGTASEAMTVMRGMMSKLRLTVNETKTRLCRVPEGTFDFLGYTIGQCWSPRTGEILYRDEAVGEEDRSPQARDQRSDQPEMDLDGCRRPGGATELDASGMVELLLPRPRQCLVSSHRPPRAAPAPSMASEEAQVEESGDDTIPRSVPARRAGAGPLERSSKDLPVGESVTSCPRAGCRKTARPEVSNKLHV